MSANPMPPARTRPSASIDAFVEAAKTVPATRGKRGRLIFALDATMSRQPTWDMAAALQTKMFEAAAATGGLDVQLVYFRGIAECRASRFVGDGAGLGAIMSKIGVAGGQTQWRRALGHARDEARRAPVGALVIVGDAMEENPDALAALGGELGLLGVKIFAFQEGIEETAKRTFQELARLTGGAYSSFDAGSAKRLASLMKAAAAYASGGRGGLAIAAQQDTEALKLLRQMR
jgi:hypothetical protein